MKIVVCVKQVPANTEVTVDERSGRPNWASTEGIINPFDSYALEEGVLLKEKHGGEVIAVTMGEEKAVQVLRDAISSGADSGILLSDDAFTESDSWVTSLILAKAVEKIGDVDLVICGRQAIDGDTAQVAPSLAAHLDWPQATYVSALSESGDSEVTLNRMSEEGYEVCTVSLPAVISVVKDINSPRIPSLRSKMAAKKAEIPTWNLADLGMESGSVGQKGSPTAVRETRKPDARDRKTVLIEGEPAESAQSFVQALKELIGR